jgi:hypothetical protein
MNNEIWLLEARIKYDLQWFDSIIIAEADSTHSGIKKPFFYEKYSYLFEEYKDRIIYVKINNLYPYIIDNFDFAIRLVCNEKFALNVSEKASNLKK